CGGAHCRLWLFASHVRPQRAEIELRFLEQVEAAKSAELHAVTRSSTRETMPSVVVFRHREAEGSVRRQAQGAREAHPAGRGVATLIVELRLQRQLVAGHHVQIVQAISEEPAQFIERCSRVLIQELNQCSPRRAATLVAYYLAGENALCRKRAKRLPR